MEHNSSMGKILGVLAVLILVVGGVVLFTSSDDAENEATNESTSQVSQEPVEQNDPVEETAPTQTVVDLAVATDDLSTLVTAVTAADLVETLSSEGPFTVFAPTNSAFAALPDGTLDSLLEAANKDQLAGILTYHVVSGKIMSSDLSDGQTATTVNGQDITVSIADGTVQINDATVITPDVEASNGVVHIIDAVLLPN